jgi:hypothetical protein
MKSVKQINDKIKALYENREPDYLKENDKVLLGRERAAFAQKEFWKNATEEQKRVKSKKSKQHNLKTYGKGTYIVRTPGNDLLDFYDKQWNDKINSTKNNIFPIPPSYIYKFRYQTQIPKGRGNNQTTGITITDIFKQTCKPYADEFPSWKVGKHPQFYPWLTDKKSQQKTFKLRSHVVEYLTEIKGKKQRDINIRAHSDGPKELMFWKGALAGYSIIFLEEKG